MEQGLLRINFMELLSEGKESIMGEINRPVNGKTYSLFGNGVSTDYFYDRVSRITDRMLREERLTENQLRDFIHQSGLNKRTLRRSSGSQKKNIRLTRILELLHQEFQDNITGIESHLHSTPFFKVVTDKQLFTIREQYYLYMIEFELVNRIHIRDFLVANFRIALLPYCLRETQEECRAVSDQVDFRCSQCRKNCQVNHVSRLLKENSIDPYIWRTVELKTLLGQLIKEHGSVGVLGIACIVELIGGMRKVMAAGIPVVGIPLNANRCPRWTGKFHDTSVDLHALDRLLRSGNS